MLSAVSSLTLLSAGHLLTAGVGSGVPDPAPASVPGLTGPVNTIISWAKWGVLVSGVLGLLIAAGKMTIGHRNRSTFAADGATAIPWVLGGLSLSLIAAYVVSAFL